MDDIDAFNYIKDFDVDGIVSDYRLFRSDIGFMFTPYHICVIHQADMDGDAGHVPELILLERLYMSTGINLVVNTF